MVGTILGTARTDRSGHAKGGVYFYSNRADNFSEFSEQPLCFLQAISLGAHAHGRRGHHAPALDHGRADDR